MPITVACKTITNEMPAARLAMNQLRLLLAFATNQVRTTASATAAVESQSEDVVPVTLAAT